MSQKLKIGDIFQVRIDELRVKYFQYIADDLTQLNSQAVRVFRETYDAREPIEIDRLHCGTIEFYAHVFIRIGLKQQHWRKVGHANVPSKVSVLFRDSNDFGNPEMKVSRDWHVWEVNEPFRKVGRLEPQYQQAEIGVVVPPSSLLHRMQKGNYDFVYPDY